MPNQPKKTQKLPWIKEKPRGQHRRDPRYHTYRWTKFSRWFRKKWPVCVECGQPAKVVDHIIPARKLPEDRFYDVSNLQGLCERCHNRKRATTDKEESGDGRTH